MKLTLLLAAPLLISAAAIDKRETQTEYDQTSTSLNEQGLCRSFTNKTDMTLHNKGLATCEGMCGKLISSTTTTSVGCLGSSGAGIPVNTDPDGNTYTMGECICDIPLLDEVVEDVVMALPAIAEIGCETLFDSLDLVLKIGAVAIPEAGETATAGMRAALKAAKTIVKTGKAASAFLQWVENPCGDTQYTEMIDDIFNPLSQASDAVVDSM